MLPGFTEMIVHVGPLAFSVFERNLIQHAILNMSTLNTCYTIKPWSFETMNI